MRDVVSVLIVDDNIEFGNLLHEYIRQERDMHVAGIARDGLEAIDMIKSFTPDIVILDIIMPNLDGIGVLERLLIQKMEHKPLFIMLSAVGQDVFVRKAISLGAEYYIVKPFDLEMLISRIRQILQEREKDSTGSLYFSNVPHKGMEKNAGSGSIEHSVTAILREAGILPHMAGYHYIREAVIYKVSNNKEFGPVTRVVYPEVAAKFNTTPQKVERAIRKAIESAWERNGFNQLNLHLGINHAFNKSKPTNSEFLAVIADRIRISAGR